MSNRLKDRIAVVTGGAMGLGGAFAVKLASEGADIAIADVADAAETVAMVEATGQRCIAVTCDVADEASVNSFAEQVTEAFGRCDVLLNNAGISPNTNFADLEFAEWKRVLAINLDSQFLMAKAFVPGMRERGFGRIVNVSSNTWGLVFPGFAHYIASKGGVIGFTRGLATDLGPHGITVNAVLPGLTRHPGTAAVFEGTDTFETMAASQAIPRIEVPEDLVGTVCFLASDDAAFMTGQALIVDGGIVRSS